MAHGEEWKTMSASNGASDDGASREIVQEARRRIPDLRMRACSVAVVGYDQRPRANAAVEVEQLTHEFAFGDQLWDLDRLYRDGRWETDKAVYWRSLLSGALSAATALCYWTERPRNDGPKTEDFQGRPQLEGFARCVEWASAAGLKVKGHPLYWSIPKCVPEWVKRYDHETRLKFAEVRVRSLVARFKGLVQTWDAVNEPLWEPTLANLNSRSWPHIEPIASIADEIKTVLTWCREEDPDAVYLVNDYGLESDATFVPTTSDGMRVTASLQRQRMAKLIEELDRRGAPPDAVGMQAHTGGMINHATQNAVYDELAMTGLPLHVTEFWPPTGDLTSPDMSADEVAEREAAYVEDYLTTAFGHPRIAAFFFWGFLKRSVRFESYSSHEPSPLYHRVRRLINETWNTRLSLTTDAGGRITFRGFPGQYSIRVRSQDGTFRGRRFSVSESGTNSQVLSFTL